MSKEQPETNESDLDTLLATLTLDQKRWVIERARCSSDTEACRRSGVGRTTLFEWKQTVPINRVLELMVGDGIHMARSILRSAIPAAALVLADALDDRDKRLRQAAAIEILDRAGEVGKPTQRQELTGRIVLIDDDAPAIE